MDGGPIHKERNRAERAGLEEFLSELPMGNAGGDALDSFKDLKLDIQAYGLSAVR